MPSDLDDPDQERQRYNVAPTSRLYAIHDTPEGVRIVDRFHWGLVPRWSRDTSGASKMINARCEGLFERPSYRPLMARHRCVVPVDGFYEWGPDRRPRYLHAVDDTPLELAGLWTTWRDPDGIELRSCTMLTADSTGPLAELHHRMPVALDPADRDLWLATEPIHPDEVSQVVDHARQRALDRWRWHEVSKAVNKVSVDTPELIVPVPTEPAQTQLFD